MTDRIEIQVTATERVEVQTQPEVVEVLVPGLPGADGVSIQWSIFEGPEGVEPSPDDIPDPQVGWWALNALTGDLWQWTEFGSSYWSLATNIRGPVGAQFVIDPSPAQITAAPDGTVFLTTI